MKVFPFFKLMLTVVLCPLFICGEENTSQPNYHPQTEEVAPLQEAERRLQQLNAEIEQYLSYNHTIIKENEEYLKKSGEWEKEIASEAALKTTLKKLNEDFLTFRDSFSQAIVDNYGPCSYSRILRAGSILELTESYANHVKKMIFPENWHKISAQAHFKTKEISEVKNHDDNTNN